MKTRLIAVLVALAAIAVFTTEASAMYHAGMGVFMQRDPGAGAGGHARMGAGGTPATAGRFIPRDPTGSNQYADGMNLYQYVRGNPVSLVDPFGLKANSCWYLKADGDPTSDYKKTGLFRVFGGGNWKYRLTSGISVSVSTNDDKSRIDIEYTHTARLKEYASRRRVSVYWKTPFTAKTTNKLTVTVDDKGGVRFKDKKNPKQISSDSDFNEKVISASGMAWPRVFPAVAGTVGQVRITSGAAYEYDPFTGFDVNVGWSVPGVSVGASLNKITGATKSLTNKDIAINVQLLKKE
jgi:hypothetical protein